MDDKRCNNTRSLALLALTFAAVPALAQPVADASSGRLPANGIDLSRRYAAPAAAPYLLVAASDKAAKPGGLDALFDDDDDAAPVEAGTKAVAGQERKGASSSGIKGFLQYEMARTTQSPVHWSKMLTRAELSSQGTLSEGVKWKLGARMDYDAVYSLYDYYPSAVAKDQRFNVTLRENYLDIGRGDWDFRLGKQHVVWGEMVGLFFADVVSARDLREFILPEFDVMRIPQWAARAEYFKDDFHAELLWIPVASYDEIGKPGAEFYPVSASAIPGVTARFRGEERPSRSLSNTNYGVRLSTLKAGWDVSGFAYSSMDIAPTFYRELVLGPQPTVIYEARHSRINQYGGTLAKDFGDVVLKGEAVYTRGRRFVVTRVSDADGVTGQNTLDWAIGLDFSLPAETRLNVQIFQRDYFAHDADLIYDQHESGYSLRVNHKITDKLEAQMDWIASVNRTDWLMRPRVTWNFERNWRLAVGADVFKGPPLGLFGQYNNRDRVYSEVRYSF